MPCTAKLKHVALCEAKGNRKLTAAHTGHTNTCKQCKPMIKVTISPSPAPKTNVIFTQRVRKSETTWGRMDLEVTGPQAQPEPFASAQVTPTGQCLKGTK